MTRDDDLPHELSRGIPTKLPAKSILRFRSVCKSWYSLISCPNFISDYSTRNLNKNGNRVLLRVFDNFDHTWSFNSHNMSFSESREHNYIPKQFLGKDVEIVGSCNGLICLFKYDRRDGPVVTFLIWNPTIRKVVELPSRTFRPCTQCAPYFGFGYDSDTNDYKVLMWSEAMVFSTVVECVYAIFYLKKGVWRVISPIVQQWDVNCRTRQECYLNGAVHWTGFEQDNSSIRILLSFDMSDECFRETRLHDFTLNDNNGNGCIKTFSTTIGGLIYVMAYKIRSSGEIDVSLSLSLWVMKEYGVTESWAKVYNIDQQSYFWPQRLHLWENGEVLAVREHFEDVGHEQDFVLYNFENRKFKRIFSTTKNCRDLCRFEESLVLM